MLKHRLSLKTILGFLLISGPVYAKKTTIVILDTGYNTQKSTYDCIPSLNKDFTNSGMQDVSHHGSYINDIITNGLNKDKYCIVNVKWNNGQLSSGSSTDPVKMYIDALEYVTTINPEYLNLSLSGEGVYKKEQLLLETLVKINVKIYVSAGNNNQSLDKNCNIYPACYNLPLNVVGSTNTGTNFGKIVKNWEDGQVVSNTLFGWVLKGTSFSTPRFLRRQLND